MRVKPNKPNPLTLSRRIYSLLLYAYPAPFRREYGHPMAQLFKDEARDTLKGNGTAGLIRLWVLTLYDLLKTALAEHIWEVFHMPMEKFMRFSGPAAMLAGVLWALLWITDFELATGAAFVIAFILTIVLSALAIFGASAILPNRTPAMVTLLVAIAGLGLFLVLGLYVLATDSESSIVWSLFMIGFWLLLLGLAAMGSVALSSSASKIVGFSLLAMALFSLVIWVSSSENRGIQIAAAVGLGVSWVVLGYGLWTTRLDKPDAALPA